jgi:parvulin-like peptidyl-prolyl isomerase
MAKKEVAKKKNSEVKDEGFNLDKRFVYGLVIIAVIVAVYFLAFDTTTSDVAVNEDLGSEIDAVRARVNGVEVYDTDIERVQMIYQAQSGQNVDEDAALERAIADVLVVQEAEERGIEVTPAEAQERLALTAQQQGVTLEQVKQGYEKQGKDFEVAMEAYVDQMKIEQLANEVVSEVPVATDEEAAAYYEENKQAMFGNSEVIVPYDDVSNQLKQALTQQKQQRAFGEFVEELKADAEIEYVGVE